MSQFKQSMPPRLPDPPETYDPNYMRELVRTVEQALTATRGVQAPLVIDSNDVVWRIGVNTAGALTTTNDP